jgi:hypothetical protein
MKILKNIFFITLPTLIISFLLFEFFFRYVIIASDSPRFIFNKEYGFLGFDGNLNREGVYTKGRFAEIKANWRLNNFNWNCAYDFSEKRDYSRKRIVVIGSSYVHGLMVNQNENFSFLLNEKIAQWGEVYPIGTPGILPPGYPDMIKYSIDKFEPDLIILWNNASIIRESFYTKNENNLHKKISFERDSVFFVKAKEYKPSVLKRFLSNSAFVRYLIYNLEIEKLALLFNNNHNSNECISESGKQDISEVERGCDFILQNIRTQAKNTPIILLQDASRDEIYKGVKNENLVDFKIRTILKKSCELNQIKFLDLTSCFIEDFSKRNQKFEFQNDYHWNPYGNKVVSDYLFQYFVTFNIFKNGLH